jgi:hypothetical protein
MIWRFRLTKLAPKEVINGMLSLMEVEKKIPSIDSKKDTNFLKIHDI